MLTPLETKLLESLRWAYELVKELRREVWPTGKNAGMKDIRRAIAAAEAKEAEDD